MKFVVAPQEFKGTLPASAAAAAIAEGIRLTVPESKIETVPMADGGPGTVDSIASATGAEVIVTPVDDPLGRVVDASWCLIKGETAVIEMASAAGLTLLSPDERDPRLTSTYGVGQLVLASLDRGARRLIVGLGGSATNDGGAGMAAALGVRFLDAAGDDLSPGGAALLRLARIDTSSLDARVRQCDVTAASDVTNTLCGPEGASFLYGPQKGATTDVLEELEEALRRYGEIVERDVGEPVLDTPGAGAAGGLGAGLIAFLNARIESGVEVVASALHLAEYLRGADLVLTGEGRTDGQTGYGKTVAGVTRLAVSQGIPVIVVAGSLGPGWEGILAEGVERVEPVVPTSATLEEAVRRPAETLATAAARAVRGWLDSTDPSSG